MISRFCGAFIVFLSLGMPTLCFGEGLEVTVLDADSAPISSAVVVLVGGPPGRGSVVLDQKKRRFHPPLLLASRGQELVVKNSDDVVHNVHCDSLFLKFNVAIQPGNSQRFPLKRAFSTLLLCHIHAEMRSRLLVVDSAAYKITDKRGKVRFQKGPGKIKKLHVWNPQDQYRQVTALKIQGRNKLTAKLSTRPLKQTPKRAKQDSTELALKSFLDKLKELSKALLLKNDLKPWSDRLETWRLELFIGRGLRAELRKKVGRSNAFRYESRLRWIRDSLKRRLGKAQRLSVKKVVDQAMTYLQSSLAKN